MQGGATSPFRNPHSRRDAWASTQSTHSAGMNPAYAQRARIGQKAFDDAYAPTARRVQQLRLLPDWGG